MIYFDVVFVVHFHFLVFFWGMIVALNYACSLDEVALTFLFFILINGP